MKKVYLSMFALALGVSSVTAQELSTKAEGLKQHPGDLIQNFGAKALGTPFWTNNFDVEADWTFDNAGQTAEGFGWNINPTSESWTTNAGVISSVSGGNYAEVGNGDPIAGTQVAGAVYSMTSTNSIDVATLSGGNTASLSFAQNGAKFTDLQEVLVSTNGTDFTTVYDNADRETLSSTGGSAYDNPEIITVNISEAIAADPSQVWIQFKVTTASTGIMYGWNIDDVVLSTLADFDISYSEISWQTEGLQYYSIPEAQIAPIDFSVRVTNNGGMDLTNVSFDIANGASVGATPAQTLAIGATDSLGVTYTPAGAGTYTFSRSVTMTEVDDIPVNNNFDAISPITVGGNVYARDNGILGAGTGGGEDGNGNFGFEAGSYFDIFTDATVGGLDLGIANNSANVGTQVYGAIYLYDGAFSLLATTGFHTVEASDLGQVIAVELDGALDVTAGNTYFAVIGTSEDFQYMTAGTSVDQTSLIFYPSMANPIDGSNFFTTGTPVVRMNFSAVGIEEGADLNASLGQNAPNPFAANSTINFELTEATEVSFEIRDISGKLVKTYNLGVLNAGTNSLNVSSADLASGIYNYTMIAGENRATKRMIVKK